MYLNSAYIFIITYGLFLHLCHVSIGHWNCFCYKQVTFHTCLWTNPSMVHVEVLAIISIVLYYRHNRNIWCCFGWDVNICSKVQNYLGNKQKNHNLWVQKLTNHELIMSTFVPWFILLTPKLSSKATFDKLLKPQPCLQHWWFTWRSTKATSAHTENFRKKLRSPKL